MIFIFMSFTKLPDHDPSFSSEAVALTIAGSDPSGGAGLQADLKVFQQLGVYGMSVVTLITVQNTQRVSRVEVLTTDLVRDQLEAVLEDIPPRAIKTGALGQAEVVRAVGQRLADRPCPLVVDPVLVSKHGHALASDDVARACIEHLLPHAWLVTPNRFEAERLTGIALDSPMSIDRAIAQLRSYGAQHVLLKLGEVNGRSMHILSLAGENCELTAPRCEDGNTHGSGCVLAAVITACIALGEGDLRAAAEVAIERTLNTVRSRSKLGKGVHPVDVRGL